MVAELINIGNIYLDIKPGYIDEKGPVLKR